MKHLLKIIFLLAFSLAATTGRSQSVFELTEQLTLDIQKLAILKSTLQEMYQGYDQLKTGFTQIRDIARDNFHLHKDFLDALWVPSPAVRSDPRLARIVNTAEQIAAKYRSSGAIRQLLPGVLQRCNQALEELAMVTTDGELRMSDAQRLAALDRIDAELTTDYRRLQQFDDGLAIDAARRQREAGDIHSLKQLYGIPH